MSPEESRGARSAALPLFAFFLLTPSCEQVQKYLGVAGVIGYLGVGFLVLHVANRSALPRMRRALSEVHATWFAVGTLALLLVIFLSVYPQVNTPLPGRGSDLDDELDVAVSRVLAGQDPYAARTYLGNPVNLFPGEILLAAPFVLALGASAYQNVFWLAVLLIVARWQLRSVTDALLWFWTLLALSPVMLQQLVTGGDHVTNGTHIMLGSLLLAQVRPGRVGCAAASGAILLGIGLSSRANFVLLFPLIVGLLLRRTDWRRAVALSGLIGVITTLVTVPVLFRAADGPGPFSQLEKAIRFDGGWPLTSVLMPAATAAIAAALAFRRDAGVVPRFLLHCAAVQTIPVMWLTVLDSTRAGAVSLTYTSYGAFYLAFGTLALWPRPRWRFRRGI